METCTAVLLVGVMTVSTVSTTAFAASNECQKNAVREVAAAIITETANSEISEETARKTAQEIIEGDYDFSGLDNNERGLSAAVKTALKFIKNNWSKIVNVLKKYGVVVGEGKGVIAYIDQILNGVINVSDSIDEAIYTVVDFVAPGLDRNVKKIIANAIRLVIPL